MRTALEKEIDDLIASGVTLRFTGRVFEQAHTPGKGKTYRLQDVMCRIRAGRAFGVTEFSDRGFEFVVRRPPARSPLAHEAAA